MLRAACCPRSQLTDCVYVFYGTCCFKGKAREIWKKKTIAFQCYLVGECEMLRQLRLVYKCRRLSGGFFSAERLFTCAIIWNHENHAFENGDRRTIETSCSPKVHWNSNFRFVWCTNLTNLLRKNRLIPADTYTCLLAGCNTTAHRTAVSWALLTEFEW